MTKHYWEKLIRLYSMHVQSKSFTLTHV